MRAMLLLLFLSQLCWGDESRAKQLIHQLDDESADRRDAASEELKKMGLEILPLLEEAMGSGSAESRTRASEILRSIKLKVALGSRAGCELAKHHDELTGNIANRGKAIAAWIEVCERTPGTVEQILSIAEADPRGAEGRAALEALNHCCAKPAVANLYELGPSYAIDGKLLTEILTGQNCFAKISPKAKDAISGEVFGTSEIFWNATDWLRAVCDSGKIAWRIDTFTGKLCIEETSECCLSWRVWWNSVRLRDAALQDIGLLPPVDGTRLERNDLSAWVERLASPVPNEARSARTVLLEAPDPLRRAVLDQASRADSPQHVKDFARRLELRDKGRILLSRRSGKEYQAFTCRLDGSKLTKVSGDLRLGVGELRVFSGGQGAACRAAMGSGPYGLWLLDLSGNSAPKCLVQECERPWDPSPDGKRIALRESGIEILEVESMKKTTLISKLQQSTLSWSADSRALACLTTIRETAGSSLAVIDAISGERRELKDWNTAWEAPLVWNPRGGELAFAGVDEIGGGSDEYVPVKVGLVDTKSLSIQVLLDQKVGRQVSQPRWSPDGTLLAASWIDVGGSSFHLLLFDATTRKSSDFVKEVRLADLKTQKSFVRWSPDGSRLLVTVMGPPRSYFFDVGRLTWTEAGGGFPESSWRANGGWDWIPDSDLSLSDAWGDLVIESLTDGTHVPVTETLDDDTDAFYLPPLR